jgi:hypothetical protein
MDPSDHSDWLEDEHTQHVLERLKKRLANSREQVERLAASGTLEQIRLAKGKCVGLATALRIMEGAKDAGSEDQA